MPNYCDFNMKIKGKKQDCQKWLDKMRDRDGRDCYDEENHFWRMWDVSVYDEEGTDDDYMMLISGVCAWSLETCCRASGYSEGIDLFEVNSKDLNIVMEAHSEELGMGFREHYIYDKGECLVDECYEVYDKDAFSI